MIKTKDISSLLLVAYVVIIVAILLFLMYPALSRAKGLALTKIPTLSVTNLNEAKNLFSSSGKSWQNLPYQPNIDDYVFGGKEPI